VLNDAARDADKFKPHFPAKIGQRIDTRVNDACEPTSMEKNQYEYKDDGRIVPTDERHLD